MFVRHKFIRHSTKEEKEKEKKVQIDLISAKPLTFLCLKWCNYMFGRGNVTWRNSI